jgi:hypothetical protein
VGDEYPMGSESSTVVGSGTTSETPSVSLSSLSSSTGSGTQEDIF